MVRIATKNPIVELDGDEMARIVWHWIKEQLIEPHIDLAIEYYDLGLPNRDATHDAVTAEAAHAISRVGVGAKCAAINPDEARVAEYGLKRAWRSPNAQVRNIIGGTLFREPVVCANIPKRLPHWDKPVIVARHAFGDQFAALDMEVPEPGELTMSFVGRSGREIARKVYDFPAPGVAMAMYNLDDSIRGFARASMQVALDRRLSLFLGTKNTALAVYDQRFKDIFEQIFGEEFADVFAEAGLTYEHRMVDELAAHAIKSSGGFVWACKNHDGDVQSDMVAEAYGSLGLMASMLVAADGRTMQTEAAHGTITRHYREHQQGRTTSTNPVASLVAWSRAIHHRGTLDKTPEVVRFAEQMEASCVATIEDGIMTKDLASLVGKVEPVDTQDFLNAVSDRLSKEMSATA